MLPGDHAVSIISIVPAFALTFSATSSPSVLAGLAACVQFDDTHLVQKGQDHCSVVQGPDSRQHRDCHGCAMVRCQHLPARLRQEHAWHHHGHGTVKPTLAHDLWRVNSRRPQRPDQQCHQHCRCFSVIRCACASLRLSCPVLMLVEAVTKQVMKHAIIAILTINLQYSVPCLKS